MAFVDIASLLAFTLIATISPGGATTLATASGATFGYRRSLPLIIGIAVGLGTMAGVAALGLSQTLLAFPGLQVAMRAAGTAYLLWLAVRLIRQRAPSSGGNTSSPQSLIGGIWLVWHNPKGWAITTSASAAYVAIAHNPVDLASILALLFASTALVSLSAWCLAGQTLARKLKSNLQWQLFNIGLAAILILSIITLWLE